MSDDTRATMAAVADALDTWPAMHETDEDVATFLREQAGRLRDAVLAPPPECGVVFHVDGYRCNRRAGHSGFCANWTDGQPAPRALPPEAP